MPALHMHFAAGDGDRDIDYGAALRMIRDYDTPPHAEQRARGQGLEQQAPGPAGAMAKRVQGPEQEQQWAGRGKEQQGHGQGRQERRAASPAHEGGGGGSDGCHDAQSEMQRAALLADAMADAAGRLPHDLASNPAFGLLSAAAATAAGPRDAEQATVSSAGAATAAAGAATLQQVRRRPLPCFCQ